jgi:hypothetical protein
MIEVRKSAERGGGRRDWLTSRFTFSFADYHDPEHMGFGTLRVLNEDWIAPAAGFDAHPHRDMEILTYPISGALEHRDSEGHIARLRPGRIQLMTAGTGIVHSEKNASADEPTHLLQIWILPEETNLAPGYQERGVVLGAAPLQLLVSPDGRQDTLRIHQDAYVYKVDLRDSESVEYVLAPGRRVWLQMLDGRLGVNGTRLVTGDGAGIIEESILKLDSTGESQALLFDLA